ncbi:MAG: RHS repeat protein [Alphaproteobacteria bacterium]|nr:RHS repeat protein [Alphaproteobacteria bacterium]
MTTNTINDLDQTTGIKDPRNNTTTYGYNRWRCHAGRQPRYRHGVPTHDKAGNVTQIVDARSVVTNFTYDAINRLATVAYPSDTALNVTPDL